MDNIILAYETLHTMKSRRKSKRGSMALKLDMSKAFDIIKWRFLEAILRKLGFGDKWIALIMECVTSISYSILVNGQPREEFKPSRV